MQRDCALASDLVEKQVRIEWSWNSSADTRGISASASAQIFNILNSPIRTIPNKFLHRARFQSDLCIRTISRVSLEIS